MFYHPDIIRANQETIDESKPGFYINDKNSCILSDKMSNTIMSQLKIKLYDRIPHKDIFSDFERMIDILYETNRQRFLNFIPTKLTVKFPRIIYTDNHLLYRFYTEYLSSFDYVAVISISEGEKYLRAINHPIETNKRVLRIESKAHSRRATSDGS